jgi:hypothetical protein
MTKLAFAAFVLIAYSVNNVAPPEAKTSNDNAGHCRLCPYCI